MDKKKYNNKAFETAHLLDMKGIWDFIASR